ncbi:FtsX-like permease family protein [Rapidithrix thailandica]|uniref:FtsX-like permease family protein n=1 Tax=Rapidithrix thailandica TaxID=413964 RepID=A0AAW9RUM8_9BACT
MAGFSFFISKRLRSKGGTDFSSLITKIAIGSVAIGLAVMIASALIFKGFKQVIQDKIFANAGHIQVNRFDLNKSYEEMPISTESEIYQNSQAIDDNIASVQRYSRKAALLKSNEEVMGVMLKGVYTDFDTLRFKKNIVEGRWLDFSDSTYSNEILISQKIANKMFLHVGDEVIMAFIQDPPRLRKLQVKGIYHTGIEDFDNLLILGDVRLIQRLNNWPDTLVGGFEVFLKDFDKLDESYEHIYNTIDYDLYPEKVTDTYVHFFDWFVILNRNVLIVSIIILVVASFNIISIMIIMIMERTPMIGTLKALGANNWQVQKIFIFNGIRLIAKGLFWGNIIGLGFGFLQHQFRLIPLDPENYYMEVVPVYFDWTLVILMNLLITLVVSIVLVFPTMIISRVEPIKAIKFD